MEHPLPDDPNDPFYLTVCFACKAVGKPDQEYIRNYGGVVCFSCRAFFRRAFQNKTAEAFVCKNGGVCVVSRKNRRKCQQCRLDRCLKAGMSQSAILTDEQKKKRFRKMIQKREREQQQGGFSGPQEQQQQHGEELLLLQEQQQQQQSKKQGRQSKRQKKRPLLDASESISDMDVDSDTLSISSGKLLNCKFNCDA